MIRTALRGKDCTAHGPNDAPGGLRHAGRSRAPFGLAALAVATSSVTACLPREDAGLRGPMGALPGLVTTATPEWIPFAVFAGEALPADPRERRLEEVRRIELDGEAEAVAWAADGRSILVQLRAAGAPCEQVVRVDLARKDAPVPLSAQGIRSRLGASLPEGAWLVAESPCAEAAATAPWSLVRLEGERREVLARPVGEVVAVASDGAQLFFTLRGAKGEGRVEAAPMVGGATRPILRDTSPLGAPGVAPAIAALVVVKGTSGGGTQLVVTSDRGGDPRTLSRGAAQDRDPSVLPDGSAVVFASTRASQGEAGGAASTDAQLYLAPLEVGEASGGPTPQRLTFAGDDNRGPSVGPGGRRLAWVSDRGGAGPAVLVARFDGSR